MIEKKFLARVLGACLVVALGACAPLDQDAVAGHESALFTNGGFEMGAMGSLPPAWTVNAYLNPGITPQTPQTLAGLGLMPGGVVNTVELVASGPSTQPDMALGTAASLRWPRYGNQCAVVNGPSAATLNTTSAGANVNELRQAMTLTASDIDPLDGEFHVRFVMAAILQDATLHATSQQPYYFIQVSNVTRATILHSEFTSVFTTGSPWRSVTVGADAYAYLDWSLVDVAGRAPAVQLGDQILVQVFAAGCSPGAHWAEVYLDGVGPTIPGITIEGAGPAQANAGTSAVYTFTYRNGSGASATGAVIDVATPRNTTFGGITPPSGATCVTPPVGAPGMIMCTFSGALAAGASAAFTVTLGIAMTATGTIEVNHYDISSSQELPLLGPVVHTRVGCAVDSDCSAGSWCHEASSLCVAQLANGAAMPTDGAHTSPTLDGTCTAAAAALVCVSGTCDPVDNLCGLRNGDGPCTVASAAVCRSSVCDPDGRCGYVDGDGPCTAANGSVVCRSTACSVSAVCERLGGCDVDADCTGGNWCSESTHTCTPRLGNGTTMPTDPPHTSPMLNGTCTAAAAALVCISGVCDPNDNGCGFASGDGPCTSASGSVVCRSTVCSVAGTCELLGGCNVDADCAAGTWCDETMHACVPRVANGVPLPIDAAHVGPTLNGMCTAAAGALVCVSGVCDTSDQRCGYATGDGPCTAANGSTTCRSTVCGTAGLCAACIDDSTCTGTTPICDIATNRCVQCTSTRAVACDGAMPVCDPTSETCIACARDFGASGSGACPSSASPFCTASGACDRCTDDASCRAGTHAGPICNATTGACGTQCALDADCDAGAWCNDVATPGAGTCSAKLPNGDALPGGTCAPVLSARACVSGVCASAGSNVGRCEQCTDDTQCSGATPSCDPSMNACVARMSDAAVSDAGVSDAGRSDAGTTGTPDTGARALDATTNVDAGATVESAGGCSCRAVGGRGAPQTMLGLAIAVLFVARRAGRARR